MVAEVLGYIHNPSLQLAIGIGLVSKMYLKIGHFFLGPKLKSIKYSFSDRWDTRTLYLCTTISLQYLGSITLPIRYKKGTVSNMKNGKSLWDSRYIRQKLVR